MEMTLDNLFCCCKNLKHWCRFIIHTTDTPYVQEYDNLTEIPIDLWAYKIVNGFMIISECEMEVWF